MDKELQERALALVERSFTGILGTVDENGLPYVKAMIKTCSDGLRKFWFCTNTSAKRVEQIKANPNASLYFYDEKSFEGLMLMGTVEVSYDEDKRQEFWQDGMERYYPQGFTDPDYVLLKFTARMGNYYHDLKDANFQID